RVCLDGSFRGRLKGLWDSLARVGQGGPLPWTAALLFAGLPALLLLLSSNRTLGTGDTWPVMPTATSLVLEGNAELSEFLTEIPPSWYIPVPVRRPYCVLPTPRGVYSSYPSGMVFFAVPVCALARLVGADLASPGVRTRLEKWCAALVTALVLV